MHAWEYKITEMTSEIAEFVKEAATPIQLIHFNQLKTEGELIDMIIFVGEAVSSFKQEAHQLVLCAQFLKIKEYIPKHAGGPFQRARFPTM